MLHAAGRTGAAGGLVVALWLGAVVGLAGSPNTSGRTRPPTAGRSPADVIVAKVNGQPIFAAEVARSMRSVLKGRQVGPLTGVALEAEVLDQLIQRQLAWIQLQTLGLTARPADVERALDDLRTRLAARNPKLNDLLARGSTGEAALRRQVAWELSWKKYLDQNRTDELLKTYFKAHRQDLDGTQVRVSHILLRPGASGDRNATADLIQRARALRRQLLAGKIRFAEAARKYSAGPSRRRGGDLGFIRRRGLMDENFTRAAFALKKDEISQPLRTRFGIHLIRLSARKPGTRHWTDVRDQLSAAVARELLAKLAAQQRGKATVEWTGAAPYIKPGTRQLVLPGPRSKQAPVKDKAH